MQKNKIRMEIKEQLKVVKKTKTVKRGILSATPNNKIKISATVNVSPVSNYNTI